ncbi:hypothetical protein EBT31_23120 [bacterium]|nr:hypothetical protein [bacterium]
MRRSTRNTPIGPALSAKTKEPITADYACSDEYLNIMQNKPVDGFPERTRGVDLMKFNPPYQSLRDALRMLDDNLLAWTGSRNNAVKMLYPKTGFMGWHHNANAPGYNILLSWSKEGKGYFRYQDPITKEIVTMHDTPGWTCKAGYYGSFKEPDKIYWHCANAEEEERLTLGYIIPHEGMWQSMVDDIETP